LNLYPNPGINVIFLEMESEIKYVEVFDFKGHMLISTPLIKNKIEVEHLARGIYFIHCIARKGTIVKQWIKI